MEHRDDGAEVLATQSLEAARRIERQHEVVARMNGSAASHPRETNLLVEMKLNKVAIDVNRALFEYVQYIEAAEVAKREAMQDTLA